MRREDNRSEIIKSMIKPFCRTKETSARSDAISERENNPEKLIKRIIPQIKEVYNLIGESLFSITPKEWDSYFYSLGRGQSRRTSSVILERMTWEQFLYKCTEVVSDM